MNKQFAVFGVGKFGESVAVELQRLGCEVIAVDKDMERVEHIADSVSYAMQADFGRRRSHRCCWQKALNR